MACGASVQTVEEGSILLARHPDKLVALELPPASRETAPPEWLGFVDPLEFSRTDDGIDEYYARLPFQNVEYGHNTIVPPPHFELRTGEGRPWSYSGSRTTVWSWGVTSKLLKVRVPAGEAPPDLADWTAKYPIAEAEYLDMNLSTSGLEPIPFALTQVQVGSARRFGLFLPAPGLATFEVTLPADPELTVRAAVLKPPLTTGLASDGAALHIEILKNDNVVRVRTCDLPEVGKRNLIRMHLAQYAGQTVKIRFRTDPGEATHLDYVFLSEPTIQTRTWAPKRLVLLFADTLRPDHLGAYGYERDTSPAIDRLAAEGTVFEEVRSISPWTLPAARAVLTGQQPENWRHARRLQTILAENGWQTSAFVSNAFLSAEFGMGDEWGLYRYRFLSSAEDTVDAALAELARNPRSDSAILVHFMEPHVPYRESEPYRHMWAGEDPPGFEKGVSLIEIGKLRLDSAAKDRYARYLKDRYDQNIRMMDDQIARLIDALPPDTTVVLYSDHGEEFWEHDGIEHGHALWEEVVRVPLIIRSPNLPPGRVSQPGSLLDLTPTVLSVLGIASDADFDGRDLSSAGASPPVAIGRVLRGAESWAVVHGGKKWVTRHGKQQLFDLENDPHETDAVEDLHGAAPAPSAAKLAEALGRPVLPVLHVIGPDPSKAHWRAKEGKVVLTLPGGFVSAWAAGSLAEQEPVIEGDTVTLGPVEPPFSAVPQEFFAVPRADTLEGLTLEVYTSGVRWSSTLGDGTDPLLSAGRGRAHFEVRWDAMPVPPDEVVPSTHPDRAEELRALGYTGD